MHIVMSENTEVNFGPACSSGCICNYERDLPRGKGEYTADDVFNGWYFKIYFNLYVSMTDTSILTKLFFCID